MLLARTGAFLVLVTAASAPVWAQPVDPLPPAHPVPQTPATATAPATAPSAPQDPYATPAQDPVLAEQIAQQLVTRAQELFDAKIWLDAKQLAVEALVESPKGIAAQKAHFIIKQVNAQLGIPDEPEAPPEPKQPDLSPIDDPTKHITKAVEAPQPEGVHDGKTAASIHGALYGGIVGAGIGSLFTIDHPASGAVPGGLAVGVAGALLTPRLTEKLHWDEAQVRTAGSGSLWGGVIGGFFADVVQGGNGGHTTGAGVLGGASIGATVGLAGGAYYADKHELTRGDVALVDTFAGMGAVGGLTVGMLMQPAQPEAYSLNSVLGTAAGVIAGIVVAPDTNTTPRRMLRVAGLSALGGALPLALLAADPSSSGVQRAAGGLATLGLVGGAWLGFYLTRNMDVGLDVPDHIQKASDAPAAVVGRDSDGTWHLGGIGMAPLSPQLAPQQHGMTFTLLAGTLR
jgi:hypothetical protein